MGYRYDDEVDLRQQAKDFEELWTALCGTRGETRFVEMMDRTRLCYGRLFIPSEVLFVWHRDNWIPAGESDAFGNWEPVVSQVMPR